MAPAFMPQEEFRTFVLAWLERRGWSPARLAEATEINQSLISKHLAEDPRKRVLPSPKNLEKYAPVIGVSYEDLMRMCGFLPGKADLTHPASDIESDIQARTAELLGAVKGAPPVFWPTMVRALFDQATISARNMADLLRSAGTDASADKAVRASADEAAPEDSSGASRRRQRPIKPRDPAIHEWALASV